MTPRTLAREWRNNEAARPRIFNEITESGMWDLFRMEGDRLLAKITPADRARITACGESFGSLNIRPLSFTAEQLAHSGLHIRAPGASLDGCDVSVVEAEQHREIARRAA